MSQLVPIDEVVFFDVITSNPSTGAVSDADSTPTFSVYEEDTDTAILGPTNLAKRTSLTGDYRGTFTASAANGFEAGKWYSVIGSATVNSVAGKAPVLHFRCAPAESVAGEPKVDVVALGGVAQSATDLKDFADTGYDPATHKVAGVVLADTATTLTNAPPDSSGVTTLAGRVTAARSGYWDNLNVGGAVASQADINNLNQSASRRIALVTSGQYERPESGSNTYTIEARTVDGDGAATNADTTPTLTATGIVSGSLAGHLSSATNPATGVYRWTYTVSSTDTIEQVRLDLSATISSSTFTQSSYPVVADFVAATWTTANASSLAAIKAITDQFVFTNTGKVDAQVRGMDTDVLTAAALKADAAAEIVTALLAGIVEGSVTVQQVLEVLLAVLAGKVDGAGTTTMHFRNQADTINRVTATVDTDGNRSAVTLNLN